MGLTHVFLHWEREFGRAEVFFCTEFEANECQQQAKATGYAYLRRRDLDGYVYNRVKCYGWAVAKVEDHGKGDELGRQERSA